MHDELSEQCTPPPALPGSVVQRIEERLQSHFTTQLVPRISAALQRGRVVHVAAGSPANVIAYRRGVLYVAGHEYVIDDD